MKAIENQWEASLSPILPYFVWAELESSERSVWKVRWHSHATYELHIILEGACDVGVEDRSFSLWAGSAILIAPHTFHTSNDTQSPFCRLGVSFSAAGHLAESLAQITADGYVVFDTGEDLVRLCSKILEEVDNNAYMRTEMTSILLSELMISCVRQVKDSLSTSNTSTQRLAPTDDVSLLDTFFIGFPPEEQTRENLAKYLHCSERQLNRKFKNMFGMTFQQKRLAYRIDYAKRLLASTDTSISEISSVTGYSDNSSFSRAFQKHTGCTPVQYRQHFAKQNPQCTEED